MRRIYYNRKSIRLKNYDYSQNGMYFITICTKNREPILSKICAESMQTNVGARGTVPKFKDANYKINGNRKNGRI